MSRHVLPLVASLGLVFLLSACGNGEQAEQPIRPAMVVQPQPATALVDSYPGEVRARYEPELAFRIAGKVSKRMVDVGDRVKKDQPLAELDPQDVRLQLEAIRAQMAAAEANLQTVRAERERYKALLGRNLVSRSQFDNVENQYRAGEARLKQVKAEYDVARNQTDYAVLRASQDGVIARRAVEVGQVVAAGQTVFTLAADGEREVSISLPEQSFGRFEIGQVVEVELWSQPDQRSPDASARWRRRPIPSRALSPPVSLSPKARCRLSWGRARGYSLPAMARYRLRCRCRHSAPSRTRRSSGSWTQGAHRAAPPGACRCLW